MQHNPGFIAMVDKIRGQIEETDIETLKRRMDAGESLTVVDVREDLEFAAKRIPGSIHIGKGVIERDIETKIPNKDQEILLVCGGGFRSALAADAIAQMGYTRAVSVDGGVRAWSEASYPLETK